MRLALNAAGPALSPISPKRELGVYEALWLEKGAEVMKRLKDTGVHQFGVRINHAGD